MAKVISAEKQAKIDERRRKEIAKREAQLSAPRGKGYLFYLFFIICLIYITDEVASAIGTLLKTEIANDMLAKYGESSVGMLNIFMSVTAPVAALGVIYKPLADKFGRKPFLLINTFGMCLGLVIIYATESIAGYLIGATLVQFFITHDMQVVYIMESAPDKHRAKIYSAIKCIAMLGVLLIPILRKTLMHTTSQWRRIYIIPAVIGFVVCLVALLLAKETDAFNRARINYLKGNTEENGTDSDGGMIASLKFMFQHKQLKWLFLALIFCETGFILTTDYEVIMTYGYANRFLEQGLFTSLEQAVESVGVDQITTALFLYPVGCAISQLFPGFISDKFGRKQSAVSMSVAAMVCFLVFWLGSRYGLDPRIVGFFCGASVGFFWANIDTICLITGESTPTALRSSILSITYIPLGIGIGISYGVSALMMASRGNSIVGIVSLCLAVPGLFADFLILTMKVRDTKGVDLTKVKGDEWD